MIRPWMAFIFGLLLAMVPGEAAGQSAAPIEPATGVRVEVPAAGVALTIPVGWSASVDYRRADPPPGQPMPAPERWIVLTTSEGSDVLDGCRLYRHETSDLALEAFASALMGRQPATVAPALFDPAGSVRIDLDLGGSETAQQWLFGAGDAVVQLACLRGEGPPDARWASMASSLELLPAME